MEQKLDVPPSAIACHSTNESLIATGHLEGSVILRRILRNKKTEKLTLASQWTHHHKRAVRGLRFSPNGQGLFSITQNCALCLWDLETGQKLRCLTRAHNVSPYSLDTLPSNSTKGQQVATGDESGLVKTWDFRADNPMICEFDDQTNQINQLCSTDYSNGSVLLSSSAEGTLAAHDLRSRRLVVKSETMHSELLGLAASPTEGRAYAGAADGYIEVFNYGEWGNLVERIRSEHRESVDCCLFIGSNLLATASVLDGHVRLVHVNPNKRLGSFGRHSSKSEGGVLEMALTCQRKYLLTIGPNDYSLKLWNLDQLDDKFDNYKIFRKKSGKSGGGKKPGKMAIGEENGGFFDDMLSENESS